MSTFKVRITLKNSADAVNATRGIIAKKDVRQTKVQAIVDTGAGTIVISERLRAKLGLEVLQIKPVRLAGDLIVECKITEPVEIRWEKRFTTCHAWVLPNQKEPLLGALPLEDMDLIVHPKEEKLVGAHGDEPLGFIY